MKKLLIGAVCCLFFSTIACKKGNNSGPSGPSLPPVTDTGANTFGCLVDGELFLPVWESGSWSEPLECNYQEVSGRLIFTLSAINGNTDKGIVFNSLGIKLKDTTVAYRAPHENKDLSARYGTYTKREYATYNNCPGEFRLTRFDYIHGIASGTFWSDAVDTVARDTVHVREGRFDVKF